MKLLYKDLRKKMMKDPEFAKEVERLRPQYEIVRALIKARVEAKLSQEEVAKRMGTTQSAVARMENINHFPSLRSIQKYAHAVNRVIPIEIHP